MDNFYETFLKKLSHYTILELKFCKRKKNRHNYLTQSIFRLFCSLFTKHRWCRESRRQDEHIAHYAVNIGRDVSDAPATLYLTSTPKDTRKQSRAPYTGARRARLNVVQRMERPLLLSWVASTSTVGLSEPLQSIPATPPLGQRWKENISSLLPPYPETSSSSLFFFFF